MLVSNEISKNQYVGDGSATEFAYTFPILDATHIEVYRQLPTETALETKLVPAEEYTVEGAGTESGGKVVFKVAPSSGTKLSILRNVPITQLYQYQELDSFPAESHENALAKLTMICQGMDERLDRAIVVSPTDTVTPDELRNGIFEASEDAIASAAAAANSETAAAASASNAASSETAAANSETAAAASASNAASSASNAASSEMAAANSEAAAANSETAAAASASNAASSEMAAANSETAAAASAGKAASSASSAAASAGNAANSETAAAASASNAASSETAAANSESNASSSANAAAASEAAAAGSASAAASSAQNAATSESNAASSASAAADSKTAAAASESNAASSASAAADSATAAAGSASSAAASASSAAMSESSAAASESSATASKNNAAASAAAAASSESNAASSASAAANSAQNAAESENNAANSAAAILELKIEVNTLNPGEQATASYNPVTGILTLGVPKGDSGDAAIATPTSLGSIMPQTGDEDGLELGTDGKLRVRHASATQRGSVLASTTAAASSVPMADSSGVLSATWLKVAMEAIAAKDNPVATLIPSFATIMPGYLLCNGAEVSRTTYKNLFDIIGTQFGEGDGSTTFNLPDFRGKTLWGADSNLMSVIAPGLPNFSGKFWAYTVGWSNASGTGPFYNAGAAGTAGNRGGEGGKACTWGFDPSRVSSVYGKSNTVQPPAIAVNIFIKY